MTMSSASSKPVASSQPARNSRPAISSESLRFIWQPSVQRWKRGSARVSGRYSVSRSSAGAAGWRGAASEAGPRISSMGSAREVAILSVTAPAIVPRSARREPQPVEQDGPDLRRDPQVGVRLGVRAEVAVVVGAAGREQAE